MDRSEAAPRGDVTLNLFKALITKQLVRATHLPRFNTYYGVSIPSWCQKPVQLSIFLCCVSFETGFIAPLMLRGSWRGVIPNGVYLFQTSASLFRRWRRLHPPSRTGLIGLLHCYCQFPAV
eukprot:300750-Hanusia_phi.AAC.1